jgi:hypothetical protein
MAKKEKDLFQMLDEMTTKKDKKTLKEAEVGIKLLEILATSARAGEFDEGIAGFIKDSERIDTDVDETVLLDFRAAIVDFLDCRKIELEEALK